MSYCIYIYRERIVSWAPETQYNKPVHLAGMQWYIINQPPPIPIEEIIANKNVGFNTQRGFYTINRPIPAGWEQEAQIVVRKIEILTALTNLANTQKSRYTNNTVGQALTDALILDEIREYRQTGSMENCTILSAFAKTWQHEPTPEALVTKLWLGYEFYRSVIAHLSQLECAIQKLLAADKYDDAVRLLNSEVEKLHI